MLNSSNDLSLHSSSPAENNQLFLHKRSQNTQTNDATATSIGIKFPMNNLNKPFQFYPCRLDFEGDTLLFFKKYFDHIIQANESITNNRAIELALFLSYCNQLCDKKGNLKKTSSIESLIDAAVKANYLPFKPSPRKARSMLDELENYQLIETSRTNKDALGNRKKFKLRILMPLSNNETSYSLRISVLHQYSKQHASRFTIAHMLHVFEQSSVLTVEFVSESTRTPIATTRRYIEKLYSDGHLMKKLYQCKAHYISTKNFQIIESNPELQEGCLFPFFGSDENLNSTPPEPTPAQGCRVLPTDDFNIIANSSTRVRNFEENSRFTAPQKEDRALSTEPVNKCSSSSTQVKSSSTQVKSSSTQVKANLQATENKEEKGSYRFSKERSKEEYKEGEHQATNYLFLENPFSPSEELPHMEKDTDVYKRYSQDEILKQREIEDREVEKVVPTNVAQANLKMIREKLCNGKNKKHHHVTPSVGDQQRKAIKQASTNQRKKENRKIRENKFTNIEKIDSLFKVILTEPQHKVSKHLIRLDQFISSMVIRNQRQELEEVMRLNSFQAIEVQASKYHQNDLNTTHQEIKSRIKNALLEIEYQHLAQHGELLQAEEVTEEPTPQQNIEPALQVLTKPLSDDLMYEFDRHIVDIINQGQPERLRLIQEHEIFQQVTSQRYKPILQKLIDTALHEIDMNRLQAKVAQAPIMTSDLQEIDAHLFEFLRKRRSQKNIGKDLLSKIKSMFYSNQDEEINSILDLPSFEQLQLRETKFSISGEMIHAWLSKVICGYLDRNIEGNVYSDTVKNRNINHINNLIKEVSTDAIQRNIREEQKESR